MPDPRPVPRRRDDAAADTSTLVQLGVVDDPPTPAPPAPPPEPDPGQQAVLQAALADAGADEDTVGALAGLTPEQVAAVARLLGPKNE